MNTVKLTPQGLVEDIKELVMLPEVALRISGMADAMMVRSMYVIM